MAINNFLEADLEGKKVLARFDFNVPIKDGEIQDTTRIDFAMPTINALLEKNISKLIMMSHLGRPKGEIKKKLSLEPIARYIAEKLGVEVYLSETSTDAGIKTLLNLGHIKLILLENLRFNPEETKGDNEFARTLSTYGDVYINDAFGVSHRKHSSVFHITQYFSQKDRFSGLLLANEIKALDKLLNFPDKPFVCLIGGAKVEDKIKTIERLLIKADKLLIGGAMAYPFLKAKGIKVGKSLCSPKDVDLAKSLIARDKGKKIHLPIDHIVSESIESEASIIDNKNIDDALSGFDIGPKTIASYSEIINSAKTIFWNGPMGLFEIDQFSKGTNSIAEMLANSDAFTVVGGGDSVNAINKSGYSEKVSHISTGGGASLEYIENGTLPAIQNLKYNH